MKRIKIAVLLILLCVLAGCSPKDTSLRAYCTESQQEFLDQSLEELPVALTYHHNDNILGRYETTDEEIISEILQALRETTIVSKALAAHLLSGISSEVPSGWPVSQAFPSGHYPDETPPYPPPDVLSESESALPELCFSRFLWPADTHLQGITDVPLASFFRPAFVLWRKITGQWLTQTDGLPGIFPLLEYRKNSFCHFRTPLQENLN